MEVCLDTDVLVNFLRNDEEEITFIRSNEEKCELATTQINVFELYYGAYKSQKKETNLRATEALLDGVTVLPFSSAAAQRAGKLLVTLEKQGKHIGFRDVFIAAIVLEHNASLKTNNVKHFTQVPDLRLL